MTTDLIVFHKAQSGLKASELPLGYWSMNTCLRSIVISEHSHSIPESLSSYQVYKSEEAFEFLLQVICGLHSPLVGETEVLGQFKEFVKSHRLHFSPSFNTHIDQLLREAKKIRAQYLQNLGCTSYGSLIRKHIEGNETAMVFIGAGSLTSDILPWCKKRKGKIQIFTRNSDKHSDLIDKERDVHVLDYEQMTIVAKGAVLVVAAPVRSQWLEDNLVLDDFVQIFDLRGESEQDPLRADQTLGLKLLFSHISDNKVKAAALKDDVLSAIHHWAEELKLLERPRPFGWEDLCTYS